MSPVKEPSFFAFQGEPPMFSGPGGTLFRRATVWRPRDYLLLFAGATDRRAIGEASTIYLRSPLAAKRIKQFVPDSRLVAILRQPADRAYSHYVFMAQHDWDLAPSFEAALAMEDRRRQEGWHSDVFYKEGGYYSAQLRVYFDLFGQKQIKVYLYEDWHKTPEAVLRDLFRFLEVNENFRPELRRSNISLVPRNRQLHRLAIRPKRIERALTPIIPAPARRLAISALRRFNSKYNLVPPPRLDPEIRQRLTNMYREDILKLQDLIGRDLSHWLETK
jgi:hypothetical protein